MSKKINSQSGTPPTQKESSLSPTISATSEAVEADKELAETDSEVLKDINREAKDAERDNRIAAVERILNQQGEMITEMRENTKRIESLLVQLLRQDYGRESTATSNQQDFSFQPASRVGNSNSSKNLRVTLAAGDHPEDSSSSEDISDKSSSDNKGTFLSNRAFPVTDDDDDDVVQLTRSDRVVLSQTPQQRTTSVKVTKQSKEEQRARLSSLPKLNNHRQSFLKRGIQAADKASTELEVQLTRQQPSYDHIRLTELQPRNVMRFHDQIIEFETCHRVSLYPIAFLISQDVRQEIASRTDGLFSEYRLLSLQFEPLMALLLKYTAPTTMEELWHALSTIPKFPDLQGYRPTIHNFAPWYRYILKYINQFTRTYEFLTNALEQDEFDLIVPSCTNKEMGLIKLFCHLIPHGYGTKIIHRWKDRKFQHFHDFIAAFTAEVHDHFKAFKFMSRYRYLWTGTSHMQTFFNDKKDTSVPAPPRQNRPPPPNRNSYSDRGAPSRAPTTYQRLHHVNTEEAIALTALEDEYASYQCDSLPDDPDAPDDMLPPVSYQAFDDNNKVFDYTEDETENAFPMEHDQDAAEQDDFGAQLAEMTDSGIPPQVNAMDSAPQFSQRRVPPGPPAYPPARPQENNNACYVMALRGACDKGSRCRYSHNTMVINAARETLKKQMDGFTQEKNRNPQQYAPTSLRQPPQVLQRQAPQAFRSDKPQHKL